MGQNNLHRTSQMAQVVKNTLANAGDIRDTGLIPWLGRTPGGEHGNPLQYSCLENPRDRGAWRATVHGVEQSLAWLKWLSTQECTWSSQQVIYFIFDVSISSHCGNCMQKYIWQLPWVSSGYDSTPNAGGLGSIPCQEIRSHMQQLRPRTAK